MFGRQWTRAASEADDRQPWIDHETGFRSITSGRKKNSFGDPVYRARAWHWLGEVLSVAEVVDVTHLDRPSPRHELARTLTVARRFESVFKDGYDPNAIKASDRRSLLEHVAAHPKYKATRTQYLHRLWAHLAARNPTFHDRAAWMERQLGAHGLVRFDPVDAINSVALGLMDEPTIASAIDDSFSHSSLPHDATRFATLDGILLLLMIYREAQDLSRFDDVRTLALLLRSAAHEFSDRHGYAGEVLDTWRHLIATRMLAWQPDFEPASTCLSAAHTKLRAEFAEQPRKQGRRGPKAPESLVPGRSERRWRRMVWARACTLSDGQSSNVFTYAVATPALEWLTKNRSVISQHEQRAVAILAENEPISNQSLPPIIMPKKLFKARRRPDEFEDDWLVEGDRSIYDLIPVIRDKEK